MKKKYLIFSILIILIIITSLYYLKPKKFFHEIGYDEIETVIKDNDSGIIVIGREGCPYCEVLIE